MKRHISLDSTIVLASLTALLYTWSTASYRGYLGVMKLNSDMMERSFHQVIYSGLLVSFLPILVILLLGAFTLYLYSHALLPIYIDWVRKSIKSKRKIIRFRRFWLGKRNTPPIELKAKATFTKVAIFTFFSFIYISSLAYFENKGKVKANTILKYHIKNEEKKHKNTSAKINTIIDNKVKTLWFLSCGVNNCAGIEEKSNLIYYFPTSSGYSFLHNSDDINKMNKR